MSTIEKSRDLPTAKQAEFAKQVFLGSTLRGAYLTAYGQKNASMNSVDRLAYAVYRNKTVQKELGRLRKEAITQVIMEKEAKIALLLVNIERMMVEGVDKNGRMMPSAMASITKTMELVAKLDGDLNSETTVNITTHKQRLQKALAKSDGKTTEKIIADARARAESETD